MIHYYPFERKKKKHPYAGIIYALAAMVSGSIATIIIKLFDNIPSLQIAAYWLFVGSLVSLSINYFNDKEKKVFSLLKRKPQYLFLQTITATSSAFFFVSAIVLLNPSTAIFIYSTTFILICVLLGRLEFHNKLSKPQYFSITGMILGLLIISRENFEISSALGIVSIIMAAISLGINALVVKKYFSPQETFALNSLRSFFGGTFLLGLVLIFQKPILPTLFELPLFLTGLLLANVVQYSFQYKAYDLEKLEVVSVIDSLRPFTVLILALIILKLAPSGLEIIGGFIMAASTIFLILTNKNLTK